jgi:hypothetical protein
MRPIAFNPETGFVYLAAMNGTQGLHAPDAQCEPAGKIDRRHMNIELTPGSEAGLIPTIR